MPEADRQAALAAARMSAQAGKQARAKERKEKMVELEAQRKLMVPPSEIEQQQAAEKAAMLSAADRQMAEELDDVKKMNQMMLYAKVVTIRDAQLNEKKVIKGASRRAAGSSILSWRSSDLRRSRCTRSASPVARRTRRMARRDHQPDARGRGSGRWAGRVR